MKKDVVRIVVIALFTFGVGYSARAIANRSTSPAAPALDPRTAGEPASPSAVIRVSDAPDPRVAALKERFEVSEGVTNWLHLIAELENASLEDMPRLAAAVGDNDEGLILVAQRWMELGPEHLFRDALAEAVRVGDDGEAAFPCHELLDYLFRVWPKRDLAAAVAALEFDSDREEAVDDFAGLRHQLLATLAEIDYEHGLEIGKRWDIELGYDTKAFRRWAAENPRRALEVIMETTPIADSGSDDPFDSLYWGDELDALAEVWAARDPIEALTVADGLPNSVASAIRDRVFAAWAGRDRDAATAWLEECDSPGIQERLRSTLAGEWGREEPAAALAWCQEHIDHPTRLAAAVMKVVEAGAAVDLAGMAEVVTEIGDPKAREVAYTTLADTWFPKSSSAGPTPPEAIEWLRGIRDDRLREKVIGEVNGRWAHVDPESFRAFLDEPLNADLGISPFTNLARSMARRDPHDTMRWAETLDGDRVLHTTFAAFDAWIPHRPAAAVEWFQNLPADDFRRPSLMGRIVSQAGGAPSNLFILDSLSDVDRAAALAAIEKVGLPEKGKERVRRALER